MWRRSLAALAVLVTACGSDVAADAPGPEIFAQTCARCHGDDLTGGIGPALGPGSNAATQPDEFLRTTIARGRGRMPSFSRTLSEDQIDRVIGFLREQQAT